MKKETWDTFQSIALKLSQAATDKTLSPEQRIDLENAQLLVDNLLH